MKYIINLENFNQHNPNSLSTEGLEIGDWVMIKPNDNLYDVMNDYTNNNAGQIAGFDKGGALLAIFVQFLNTPNDNRIQKYLYTNNEFEKSRIVFIKDIIGVGKTPEEAKKNAEISQSQNKFNL